MPAANLKQIWVRKDDIPADFLTLLASLVGNMDSPDSSISITYDGDQIHFVVNPASIGGATTVTVVTAIQFDAVAGKFQKKTRTINVLSAGTESAWTDIVGTTVCTP